MTTHEAQIAAKLDQAWREAEEWIDELKSLASMEDGDLIRVQRESSDICTLIRKACAMTAFETEQRIAARIDDQEAD